MSEARRQEALPDFAETCARGFRAGPGGNRCRRSRGRPTLAGPGLPSGAAGPDFVTGARHRLPRRRRHAGRIAICGDHRDQRCARSLVRTGDCATPIGRCRRRRRRARRGVRASRATARSGGICRCHRARFWNPRVVQPVRRWLRRNPPGSQRSSGGTQVGRSSAYADKQPAAAALAACQST